LTAQIRQDYLFLRRVEHYLQILEDRQIHALPRDPAELEALAKRVLGVQSDAAGFMAEIEQCTTRIRQVYTDYLLKNA